jgi:hypothetical protein
MSRLSTAEDSEGGFSSLLRQPAFELTFYVVNRKPDRLRGGIPGLMTDYVRSERTELHPEVRPYLSLTGMLGQHQDSLGGRPVDQAPLQPRQLVTNVLLFGLG